MGNQDYHDHFEAYEKRHKLGKSIHQGRNYDSLKKEFNHLFTKDYAFFTTSKLKELSQTCDRKLVARGHMSIELDKHDRPVYTSKTFLESHKFTGPYTEDNSSFYIALFAVLFLLILLIMLLIVYCRANWQYWKETIPTKEAFSRACFHSLDEIKDKTKIGIETLRGKCRKKDKPSANESREKRKTRSKQRRDSSTSSSDSFFRKEKAKMQKMRDKLLGNDGRSGYTKIPSSEADGTFYLDLTGQVSSPQKDEVSTSAEKVKNSDQRSPSQISSKSSTQKPSESRDSEKASKTSRSSMADENPSLYKSGSDQESISPKSTLGSTKKDSLIQENIKCQLAVIQLQTWMDTICRLHILRSVRFFIH